MCEFEEKSGLVAHQLTELMEKVFGEVRPVIILFPAFDAENSDSHSVTNIMDVDYIRYALQKYLDSLAKIEALEDVTKPIGMLQ